MIKQELRQRIRSQKRSMSLDEIEKKSERIFEKLENLKIWKEMELVYSYVSYNQEVQTAKRMEQWMATGKRIAVPKVVGEDIRFYEIESMNQLQKGYQNILEPNSEKIVEGEAGIVLMPGLAFDRSPHRLGYGGGFYDRYLQRWKGTSLTKIALCYSYQLLEAIPFEEHDYQMDVILTEKEWIKKQ